MKSFVVLALLAFAVCSDAINQKFVNELKQIAPYDVYEPEENPFRDWTDEEIDNMLGDKTRYRGPKHSYEQVVINEEYDFRKTHPECNLGVNDQARCGSCWAFGSVQALQGRFCLKGGLKKKLSYQDPVSCDRSNAGCNGGNIYRVWDYLTDTGVVDLDCFPYTAGNGRVEKCITQCKNGAAWKKYQSDDYNTFGNPTPIMKDLKENGPISTRFDVYSDFMSYKGGIYRHTGGYRRGGHAVTIVGFGHEDGTDFWIVQNSWGPRWGEQGYFRIAFGEVGIDSNSVGGIPLL